MVKIQRLKQIFAKLREFSRAKSGVLGTGGRALEAARDRFSVILWLSGADLNDAVGSCSTPCRDQILKSARTGWRIHQRAASLDLLFVCARGVAAEQFRMGKLFL